MIKLIKWLSILVILLFAVFLAVGFITPEFSYESNITVNTPVEKAFNVFMDETKMQEWMPSFLTIENIGGKAREIGSKWKLTFNENGDTLEVFEEVTAYEPNERFAFNLGTHPFIGHVDIHFVSVDSTTEIKAITTVNGKNIAWKSLLALWKSAMKRRAQEQYDNLKRVIEGQVDTAGSP